MTVLTSNFNSHAGPTPDAYCRFSFNLSPLSTCSQKNRHIHHVWRRRRQSPASVVRRWTSFWESALRCYNTCTIAWQSYFLFTENMNVLMIKGYLQHCRSLMSLKSPVSGSSLFSSLLISLLISLCWRRRSSSLAVRSSQDLERESGWPGVKPTWFSMPSEQDIRFRFKLRPR